MKLLPPQKILIRLFLLFGFCFIVPQQAEAQFFKKLVKKAEQKIENEADQRAQKRVDKTIDKGFDKVEDEIDGKGSKKDPETENSKKNENSKSTTSKKQDTPNTASKEQKQNTTPQLTWSRFDFVSGDQVIFEDSPDINEENGEFPSRWDLKKGNAEVVNLGGENVIAFPKGGEIVPYLENPKEDYLPEVFTIELDAYFRPGSSRRLWLYFRDTKNQASNGISKITFYVNSVTIDKVGGTLPGKTSYGKEENGGWRHISIAYTKGKLKVYMQDARLVNIPHLKGNPTGLTLEMDGYSADQLKDLQYIKNIRIAKGGVKYYDRLLSDGKIVINGIKFLVNEATLKPESMGPINKIFKLMQKQPTLNFSVEGHTDADGQEALNQNLSEARGKTVMQQLIRMGIAANRLKYTGHGESKPIDTNSTPEGKANNRRVEFIKF